MTAKPGILILIGLVLLALALLWPETNRAPQSPEISGGEAISQDDFDYYLDGVVTNRFTGSGQLSYRLLADRVIHFPEDDRAVLTTPRFTRFPANQNPVGVSALTGFLVPGSVEGADILDLQEQVVLTRTLDNGALLTISTASLQLDTGAEIARTADPVRLESGNSELNGTGMKITLTDNRLELLADVRGQHE